MLLLLACAPEPTPDSDTDPVEEGPVASFSADEVGQHLQGAFVGDLPSFPLVAETFARLLSYGDGRCPPPGGGFEILQACEASSGYVYQGAGGGGGGWDGPDFHYSFRADLVIEDPDGQRFEVGGDVDSHVTLDPMKVSEQFIGSFSYPPAGSWLASGTSAAAWLEAAFPIDAPPEVSIEGGYQLGGTPVFFVGFADAGCPSGVVRLRDPSGYWYDLTYDPEDCGCGDVTFESESLGHACADPAAMFERLGHSLNMYMGTR